MGKKIGIAITVIIAVGFIALLACGPIENYMQERKVKSAVNSIEISLGDYEMSETVIKKLDAITNLISKKVLTEYEINQIGGILDRFAEHQEEGALDRQLSALAVIEEILKKAEAN